MSGGQKPDMRLIRKKEGDEKWTGFGGAWLRDDGVSYSVSIDLPDGSKIKCLMVQNTPFDATKFKSSPKPAPSTHDVLGGDDIPF